MSPSCPQASPVSGSASNWNVSHSNVLQLPLRPNRWLPPRVGRDVPGVNTHAHKPACTLAQPHGAHFYCNIPWNAKGMSSSLRRAMGYVLPAIGGDLREQLSLVFSTAQPFSWTQTRDHKAGLGQAQVAGSRPCIISVSSNTQGPVPPSRGWVVSGQPAGLSWQWASENLSSPFFPPPSLSVLHHMCCSEPQSLLWLLVQTVALLQIGSVLPECICVVHSFL